jgi:SAM-dependent methyltransferase
VSSAGLDDRIVPFNLDITKRLPFPDECFDVVFCMDAVHYFGAKRGFLAHIAPHLKAGGYVVVGNPCFDREFSGPPRSVYRPPWVKEFSKYHSPLWWKDLFERSGLFERISVEEPPNGEAYWEDDVLFELNGSTNKPVSQLEADADQIVFGRDNPDCPRLTHFILNCRKKARVE